MLLNRAKGLHFHEVDELPDEQLEMRLWSHEYDLFRVLDALEGKLSGYNLDYSKILDPVGNIQVTVPAEPGQPALIGVDLSELQLYLDDLIDVDTENPLPTDGQVLTWDDGQGLWVPADVPAPPAPSLYLDDLLDVDTTTTAPADQDTLTYDDALGQWVPKAGGSGGIPSRIEDSTGQVFVDTELSYNDVAFGVGGDILGAVGADATWFKPRLVVTSASSPFAILETTDQGVIARDRLEIKDILNGDAYGRFTPDGLYLNNGGDGPTVRLLPKSLSGNQELSLPDATGAVPAVEDYDDRHDGQIIRTSGEAYKRIPIGADGQVLKVVGAIPTWADLPAPAGGGKVVGWTHAVGNTHKSTTTAIPIDDTLPGISDGAQVLTVTYNPVSTSNRVYAFAYASIQTGGDNNVIGCLTVFVGSAFVGGGWGSGSSDGDVFHLSGGGVATSLSGTMSVQVRFGPQSGFTAQIGGRHGARMWGGGTSYHLIVLELEP